MKLNPRERLLRALRFEEVDIIPVDSYYTKSDLDELSFLDDESIPEKKRQLLAEEMAINPAAVTRVHCLPAPGTGREDGRSEWGVEWEQNLDVDHPIKDWDDLLSFKVPVVRTELFPIEEVRARQKEGKTLVLGGPWSQTTFEMYRTLRGFENCLTDPILYPDHCHDLINRIEKYNLAVIKQWVETGCDMISFADDLGSMRQILITPDLWRKFYKPSYKRYCDLIHEGGAKSWMHSDGAIDEIIPDLIEVGLDILDPVQAECVDIEKVALLAKQRLVIWGGMDSHLIAGKSYDAVRAHASEAISVFRGFEGGMVGTKSNYLLSSIDASLALYHAFRNYSA